MSWSNEIDRHRRPYAIFETGEDALSRTRARFSFCPLSFFRSKSFWIVLPLPGGKRPPPAAYDFSVQFSIFYTLFANCMMNVVYIFYSRGSPPYSFSNLLFFISHPLPHRPHPPFLPRLWGFRPDKLCTMKIRLRWFTTTTAAAVAAVETFPFWFRLCFPPCKTSFGWPRRRFSRDRSRFLGGD